jgi:cobalt-precorrin-5B (C1)-methyltransferase
VKKNKKLRSGYTTGACAAAAAKAAVQLLLAEQCLKPNVGAIHELPLQHREAIESVEIPFPDKSRHIFRIKNSKIKTGGEQIIARASVIKDAGDDPDVTNGAEIVAESKVGAIHELPLQIIIKGGKGVGTVTKPGLSVPVGEPAINPVPRQMIRDAAAEAILESGRGTARCAPALEITISVPNGEELAKKTLNHRLGIVGGISILGTTGIVKPVSAEAWTATIASSMDVAKAMGHKEVVISAGRTSETAHMK